MLLSQPLAPDRLAFGVPHQFAGGKKHDVRERLDIRLVVLTDSVQAKAADDVVGVGPRPLDVVERNEFLRGIVDEFQKPVLHLIDGDTARVAGKVVFAVDPQATARRHHTDDAAVLFDHVQNVGRKVDDVDVSSHCSVPLVRGLTML